MVQQYIDIGEEADKSKWPEGGTCDRYRRNGQIGRRPKWRSILGWALGGGPKNDNAYKGPANLGGGSRYRWLARRARCSCARRDIGPCLGLRRSACDKMVQSPREGLTPPV